MKCLRIPRVVAAATLAFAAAQVGAAEGANPTGNLYYGYGQGSFGYTGAGYTPGPAGNGVAPGAPGPDAGYSYGYTAPGYAPADAGAYPGYGYGDGYAGGYGGQGCDACDACGGRHGRHHHRRHRHHCCSFGGNCDCCSNSWSTYCGPGCDEGAGCCGAPVKVHRRHRALGCGAGPCVDASCCTPPSGHGRHCHARRRRRGCAPVTINYGMGGPAAYDMGGDAYDMGGPAEYTDNNTETGQQPSPADPDAGEPIESPGPSLEPADEPQPRPAEESSR